MRQETLFMIHVQTQCCQFFFILIKKELMFFTNGCPSLATRVGRAYLQLKKKRYLQFEKIKTKKGYVQFPKIKTKRKGMYNWKKKIKK